MSTPGVKMSLACRKDIRDSEANKVAELAKLSEFVGSPVTFNWEQEPIYAALADKPDYKERFFSISVDYLKHFTEALKYIMKDNPHLKKNFMDAWKTKNLIFNLVPDAEWDKYKGNEKFGGQYYQALRFTDKGEIELFTAPDRFWSNLNDMLSFKLQEVVPTVGNALPFKYQAQINDTKKDLEADMAKIRALKGLSDATFDVEAEALAVYNKQVENKQQENFNASAFKDYIHEVYGVLEKQWKDDMIQEAILEHWTAPHKLTFFITKGNCQEGAPGMRTGGYYNGLRLKDGNLEILARDDSWWSNVGDFYSCDFSSVL